MNNFDLGKKKQQQNILSNERMHELTAEKW